RRKKIVRGAAGLASGSLAVLLAVAIPAPPREDDGVRAKGLAPHLVIHRQKGTGAERIDPAVEVRAGDVLQVSYATSSAHTMYGTIFSLDGRGTVTLHLPRSGAQALEL